MQINNLQFAKNNEQLSGEFLLASLPRVFEWLQEKASFAEKDWVPNGLVKYNLSGSENALKQAYLKLSLQFEANMICQRCLLEMPFELKLNFNYLVVPEMKAQSIDFVDESYDDADDEFDLLPASQSMDLIALVEDEIILALPISPLHAENCVALTLQSGEKPNPFAVLKNLKRY